MGFSFLTEDDLRSSSNGELAPARSTDLAAKETPSRRRKSSTLLRSVKSLLLLSFLGACTPEERPALFNGLAANEEAAARASSPGLTVTAQSVCAELPDLDTTSLCGTETVEVASLQPTLFILLDTSGSMASRLESGEVKLNAAVVAIRELKNRLSNTLHFGLASFPGDDTDESIPDSCGVGTELIAPLTREDICEESSAAKNFSASFTQKLTNLSARGGTPLGPTLASLKDSILATEGEKTLLLLTDGAPNCNPAARCDIDRCGIPPSPSCGPDLNCCAPEAANQDFPSPASFCFDDDYSRELIEELADEGVKTRIIGLPSTEEEQEVLSLLAQAGGAERDGEQAYFDAKENDELIDALSAISEDASDPCRLTLAETPMSKSTVNVWLGSSFVAEDPDHGWTLEESTIEFHGNSCELLSEGVVSAARVVFGCPTIVR
ncbi:MAG: hypothetical protein MK135_03355 [Polyangiaceae bacterium]|nr:hypothetical protein [Polyangiaceae bacterium]